MDAVPLAAGEVADLLFLVRPLEIELRDVGARRHLALAEHDIVQTAGDFLEDGIGRIERLTRLIDIRTDHGIANAKDAAVGLFLADDHAEERRLARAVGADHADDAARRQAKRHVFK